MNSRSIMDRDMIAEIETQRQLRRTLEGLEDEIETIASQIDATDGTTYVIGCGDSYFAGVAAAPLFAEAGVPFQAVTSYEFSRYVAPHIGSEDAVLPVSMSGNSARTVEGALRADDQGAYVAGTSNSPDGRLNETFDDTFILGLETEPGWTPGTLTYLASIMVLCRLGIELGADGPSREQLVETLDQIDTVIEEAKPVAETVAANLSYTDRSDPFYVLGGGPSHATAQYGAAKFLEICNTLAVGQESEEFAHQEFWVVEKTDPVFVVAPSGSGFGRTQEVADCLREFGTDLVVVTDVPELASVGKYSFDLPDQPDLLSPLLTAIPLQLVSYYYALELGLDPNRRTNVDPFRKQVSRNLTRGSEIDRAD